MWERSRFERKGGKIKTEAATPCWGGHPPSTSRSTRVIGRSLLLDHRLNAHSHSILTKFRIRFAQETSKSGKEPIRSGCLIKNCRFRKRDRAILPLARSRFNRMTRFCNNVSHMYEILEYNLIKIY